ncbi:MAG TPA: right-handed parallel beta-helix repeat-containing protein [Thermoanaerobaculia bacterium]|nr:right-handed parallel beta-helix repeat-containing protein [Thermoanaerobaculia bacterium]
MTRSRLSLVLALLVLAAATASAQTNLTVLMYGRTDGISVLDRAPVGSTVYFDARPQWAGNTIPEDVAVEISVPGTVLSITPDDAGITCTAGAPIRCRISARTARFSGTISVATVQRSAGTFKISASITSSTPDSPTVDNRHEQQFRVLDRPQLEPHGWVVPYRMDPGKAASGTVYVDNTGAAASTATLTLTLPEGGTFTGAKSLVGDVTCEVESAKVICTAKNVGFYQEFGVEVSFLTLEDLNGGRLTLRAVAEGTNAPLELQAVIRTHILVTNTDDAGSGSLRQALQDAQARCAEFPCVLDFRVAGVIRPRTPLPEVRGRIDIDGNKTTEIDGSLLEAGSNGFVVRTSCDVAVRNLTMTGFPRHAVEIALDHSRDFCPSTMPGNRLTITNNVFRENERGIVTSVANDIEIVDNVIDGNRRAGVFLGHGGYATVTRNRITNNGASGMFVNTGGADIDDNVIAFNGEWGVARTQAPEIALRRNSIYGNTSQGIDVNLDNETPNRADDSFGAPNKPVLFSAAYDAASDKTIVRGHLDSGPWNHSYPSSFTIEVYASSSLSAWGFPQGEKLVGSTNTGPRSDFELAIAGDQRGKFLTATNTRAHIIGFGRVPIEQTHGGGGPADTSEFSNAIEVH